MLKIEKNENSYLPQIESKLLKKSVHKYENKDIDDRVFEKVNVFKKKNYRENNDLV